MIYACRRAGTVYNGFGDDHQFSVGPNILGLILRLGRNDMTTATLLVLVERIVGFLANLAVCAVATKYYLDNRKRCLALIALSAGIGALFFLSVEFAGALGNFVLYLADLALWVVGCFTLLREYGGLVRSAAHPGTPPNGGPAVPFGDSGVGQGPPSVN